MYPVRIVKMITGETLIAGLADAVNPHGDQGVYTLEEPMTIMQIPSRKKKNSQLTEAFIFMKRWLEFSEDEMFIIPKSSVICVAVPDKLILRDYNSAKASLDIDSQMVDDEDEGEDKDEGKDNDERFFDGPDDDESNPPPPFE